MKKLLIIFTLFFFNSANSEIVKSIVIKGNERISDETIKVYGDIQLNQDYTQGRINKILKNLYSTDFFEDVSVQLSNGVLQVNLKEYQTINAIELRGEKAKKVKKVILERIQLKEKSSYIKSALNDDINLIKKLYSNLGYNFTKVDAKIQKFSENRVNLVFIIDKGTKTKISKIYFIGDKKIKDRRLRDIIVSEEDKFWKIITKNTNLNKANTELDKRLLVNYYKSVGYYDVQIISSSAEIKNENKTNLTFNINAGPRYRINKISTKLDPVINKNLFLPVNKEFKKIVGKYYSPFLVKKLLEEIDRVIDDNDLQFIEHSVSEVISDDNIEIQFNIFEGSKESVERINIKGNTITAETVIRGELLLDEGDPFNRLKLDQSINRLKGRNIFGEVKKEVLSGSSNDMKIINITVEEKPTGEISAGAGVGTQGGSFAFDIKENNWLGKGIQIASFIDVNQETLKGQIQFSNPNHNFSGNELNYHISSIQNDKPDSGYENSLISLGVGTQFEQYKDIYLSPSLNVSFDDLDVDSTASANLKKQAGSFSELSLDYGVTVDKRDRTFMPTDGYFSSFSQTLPVYADSPYIKNTLAFSKYKTVSKNLVGAFKLYASNVTGLSNEDVRLSRRINLPSRKIRGFEYGKIGPKDGADYIGGNNAVAANLEANLPNILPESTKTEISLFLDFANIWGVDYDSTLPESSKLRSSFGGVIGWTSPVGPMSFVLSQNISKADTDKEETFSFRLGTTF